jgi:hypothetical protein
MAGEWPETTATIVASKLVRSSMWRAEGDHIKVPRYSNKFRYEAQGTEYFGKYETGIQLPVGHTLTISYDPATPKKNTGTDPPRWRRVLAFWAVVLSLAYLLYLWVSFSR